MTRNWDTTKLDALLVEMREGVGYSLEVEEQAGTPEEESVGRVEGYWLYKLLECQDGPMPPRPEPTISGPLFEQVKP